jgi:hypothetical protein
MNTSSRSRVSGRDPAVRGAASKAARSKKNSTLWRE